VAKVFRTILAVLLGLVVGSVVNMGLIMVSGKVIAPPAGADVTTMEGLKASIHLFEPRHFLFPFLAHSLGTLVGAFTATLVARGTSAIPAFVVACCFLVGGIISVVMLPGPTWFAAVDLLLAYVPAGWLGFVLAARVNASRGSA
jgi:hypothetical protein